MQCSQVSVSVKCFCTFANRIGFFSICWFIFVDTAIAVSSFRVDGDSLCVLTAVEPSEKVRNSHGADVCTCAHRCSLSTTTPSTAAGIFAITQPKLKGKCIRVICVIEVCVRQWVCVCLDAHNGRRAGW